MGNIIRGKILKAVKDIPPIMTQLIKFQNSPKEARQSYYDHTKDPLDNIDYYEHLKDKLLAIGIPVEEVDIDISDFEHWLNDFSEIRKHYQNTYDVFIEKCLEYYLAFRHLKISDSDIYVDIAASESPWASILNKKGIKSYRLDLAYPEGIHDIDIGTDAGNIDLSDGFCSIMSLHCAYECFQGDTDIQFLKQAARILNEKGRYGIVPLYLEDIHYVAISPYCNQRDVKIESEAKKVWRDDKYKTPFSRHYSPEAFQKRIYSNLPNTMTGKVLYFRNLADVIKYYKGQKIYCFFMFYCEK